MLSRAERSVYEKYRHEPVFVAGAALKCCVMLTFLALVAWIGVDSADQGGSYRDTHTAPIAGRQSAPENASARHRKIVFEERRSQWHERQQRTASVRTTASH